MRRCLAMGADRGDPGRLASTADPITVARVLARVVQARSPDLVFCGVQSSDGVQAATGTALAELLDLPRVAVVTRSSATRMPVSATVERELEGGLVDCVEVDTPALLTIQTGINQPRYANLRAIKQAEQVEIDVRSAADGGSPPTGAPDVRARPRAGGGDDRRQPCRDRRPDRSDRQGAAGVSVLVVAEHIRGQVRDVTRELVTAGRGLGPVTVAVIARDPAALVDAVNIEGVEEIVTVQVATDEFENDVYQAALEALIASRQPRVTLLGFTVNSMGYGPAVAAKLGLGFASDVHGVTLESDAVVATRSFYGSKVTPSSSSRVRSGVLLLLRPDDVGSGRGTGWGHGLLR